MLDNMKISNKEKTMLFVLGSIIVGFLYYQFVYSSQVIQLQGKIKEESEIKQKYETVMNTIKSMESKKSDVKILNAKIENGALPFYPTISEEHIILELNQLLEDSGLKGGITFAPIVSDSVEVSKVEQKSLAESSLQSIVDEYSSNFKDTEKTGEINDEDIDNSTKSETTNNASGTSNADSKSDSNSANASNKKDSKDVKKNTVQYLKCEVKFEGTYDSVNKFLNTIGLNEKKIVVNSIKISADTLDGVKGTMSLEIYSIPKINDELETYLKWDLNNTYGKSVPFSAGTTGTVGTTSINTGTTTNTSTSVQENKEPSDFIALVKPTASDLPTITIGKAKDSLRTSYVYADSNSVENVEMTLIQDGEKYYYKYKTSKGTFPANYDGLGAEFVPESQNIVLNILSRSRLDANDDSGMKFKIINKTDKLLKVNISGEDSNNPRVTVEGDLSNVSVNNN
jgi:type IV pilus assembly protein PilO